VAAAAWSSAPSIPHSEDTAMKPRVGTTLANTTDATTVIVVRWGDADLEVSLEVGGVPLPRKDAEPLPASD
jgi:hypothetical protein